MWIFPPSCGRVVNDIGYNDPAYGFDGSTCGVITSIDMQSPDIALGVNTSFEAQHGAQEEDDRTGAGRPGHDVRLCLRRDAGADCRWPSRWRTSSPAGWPRSARAGNSPYLRPDGKTQVTVEYVDGKPARVDTVVVSTQHAPEVALEQIRSDILEHVVRPVIPAQWLDDDTKYFINPTGRFVVGGPVGDSGLTGRKLIVDTYGGYGRHGGGAFSGKDPTKVDRSAAYAARYVAKNIVAAGLARKCEVQLAYAIGVAHPVSVMVESFGTSAYSNEQLAGAVKKVFDLRPSAIIRQLDLRRPIYRRLAAYGHMGREDLGVAWEKTDRTEELKAALA